MRHSVAHKLFIFVLPGAPGQHRRYSAADLTNIIKKEIISKLKTASVSAQTAQNRQNKISGI